MKLIQDVLKKDIDRLIDGVIKADDGSRILQEVDEYVLTNSIAKQLERVVESYLASCEAAARGRDPYPINGVWISGYFGSGKSHLLKMLAYLLDETQDKNLRTIFLSKIEDQFLKANMEKVLRYPGRTILFNIDQMSDGTKAKDSNTILLIFEKALNKMQGFYHENRYIAEFERHLAEEGEYDAFVRLFEELNGKSWEESRSKVFGLGRSRLIETLKQFKAYSEESARELIDHYKTESSLTAESFARRVREWLDTHPEPGYRVAFFIDEVGQFIASNTGLMLNLQTMAETLGTICEGRAWIFVTSQEDLDKVIGDPEAKRVNDFTKIEARFKQRISLSSGEVQEVIQKRLLEKKAEATDALEELYRKEKENFRTLFSFRQGGKDIYFKDRLSFCASYPFQAYQYYLLQQSLRGLSEHNAFMGRHVSRGERSMLEIFQDVTRSMKSEPLYRWATFDLMFEGIRFTLKTELLQAVNLAEQQLDNGLAVRLLKILLMVKYVRDFRATAEHLAVLLLPEPGEDLAALNRDVESALSILVQQFYIERNGEVYQYLTDEEKDIEKEINNTSVDYGKVRNFYSDVVFSNVIRSGKIRYNEIGEDYQYKKAVDDEIPRGTGFSDLTIRLITAFHPQAGDRNAIINQSSGKKELLVFLDSDRRFYMELLTYFRVDTYTRQSGMDASSPQMERILSEKQRQNGERRKRLVEDLVSMCGQAELYIFDTTVDVGTNAPTDRLTRGFEKLIVKAYPNLRLLKVHYTEASLKQILLPDDKNRLFSDNAAAVGEDEQEMLNFILRKDGNSEPVTLAGLQTSFTGGQYGWYPMAVLAVLAKLFVRNSVEVREGGKLKSSEELFSILSRNRDYQNYLIKPAPIINSRDLEQFKNFYHEFFHKQPGTSVAKELSISFRQELLVYRNRLRDYYNLRSDFPFLERLAGPIDEYGRIMDRDWSETISLVLAKMEEFLESKEELEDPVVSFMEGDQHSIWLEISRYVGGHRDNIHEMEREKELAELEQLMTSPAPYRGGVVKKAKALMEELKAAEDGYLEKLKEEKKREVAEAIEGLAGLPEYGKLKKEEAQKLVQRTRDDIYTKIDEGTSFSSVRDKAQTYAPGKITSLRAAIIASAEPEKKVVYASREELAFSVPRRDLVTEGDVREYARALESHYLAIIKSGKRIGV